MKHNYNIVEPAIEDYIIEHLKDEDELLDELNRETHLKHLYPRMISGHIQGKLLAMIVKMIGAKSILEVGTYTGYSAICMARELPADGKLLTIDVHEELREITKRYFERAGLSEKIDQRFGLASDIIPGLDGPYDLVFLDADKENYPMYLEMVLPLLPQGGYLLADNVLWSGKVLDPQQKDKVTMGIKTFNKMVRDSPKLEGMILSIRDGLSLSRKI